MPRLRLALILALVASSFGGCGSSEEDDSGASGGAPGGGSAGAAGAGAGAAGAAGGGAAGTAGGGTAGSGGASTDGAAEDGADGSDSGADGDGDGLIDAEEQSLAEQYFPYYSIAPGDGCPLHAVLFRATPAATAPGKVNLWYVVLYQNDCGAFGHVGDDEVFGALIDPTEPAPAGILALRAISHQSTPCEKVTTCGSLPKCGACAIGKKNGKDFPVVFASKDKHGGYVDTGVCALSCDFGTCALNPSADAPKLLNAGEPGKPLTNDLTASGLITAADGWTAPELMSFDPWKKQDFGSAGDVSSDLVDPAFVIAPSGC